MRNYYIVVYYCPKHKKFKYRAMYNLDLILQFFNDFNITIYEIIDKNDSILISKNMEFNY